MAFIVGLLAGAGAILFAYMIEAVQWLFFGGLGELFDIIETAPIYKKLLVPAAGGLIVGPIIYHFAREAKGHGVPEVMSAVALRGGVIRQRVAGIKALASAISIGTGSSVGSEGPIVQIGSAMGSTIGQALNFPGARMKSMVACGAAGGIAAIFNAPIAGVMFSLEVILGDIAFSTFSPLVISAVTETLSLQQFPPPDLTTGMVIIKLSPGSSCVEGLTVIITFPEELLVIGFARSSSILICPFIETQSGSISVITILSNGTLPLLETVIV